MSNQWVALLKKSRRFRNIRSVSPTTQRLNGSVDPGGPRKDNEIQGNEIMRVILNGKERDIPNGLTVDGLLNHLDVRPQRVAVEINRVIVKRERFAETYVQPGDTIEILQFVGGG